MDIQQWNQTLTLELGEVRVFVAAACASAVVVVVVAVVVVAVVGVVESV